ncbi:DUF4012 domain-containing protein [Candidatus Peregrinibacteria bacterium]|nr:MAG: DUF4012 domain-containing protein [Candidatus Peregrinibacteria bacterium]
MNTHYSPYQNKIQRKRFEWPTIKLPSSAKWILGGVVALIMLAGLALYTSLGSLRFFANHYLALTFFHKQYLVVLQNNYELRPGGGFITAYGNLETWFGIPTELQFHNAYDIDTAAYVTPPYPHEELLKNEWYQGYTFRDANWSLDNADNAKTLTKFYQEKFAGEEVDGIITINFSLIERLLGSLGPIDWNGKVLTKNNLFNELEFEVNNIDRHNIEALTGRKSILGELGSALIKKAKWRPFKTRAVLEKGLQQKEVFVWLHSNRLQNKLIEKGWANTLNPQENGDTLAVNLANLGAKKADRYLSSEVDYFADLTGERPLITVEVNLRYPGSTSTYGDNYRGYLRVAIPKKAEWEEYPVDSEPEALDGMQVMGSIIKIPAGSKTTLTYKYFLPRTTSVKEGFTVRLIKQSGSEMFYRVALQAPEGGLLKSDELETRENRAFWNGFLINDTNLSIERLPDTTPPFALEQQFQSLSVIEIIWNEALNANTVSAIENYQVTDLNDANQETDTIKVVLAELAKPNRIEIELSGITPQPEEHFLITLKNIKDKNGNEIAPSPKTLTAVQRFNGAVSPKIDLGTIELEEPEQSVKLNVTEP